MPGACAPDFLGIRGVARPPAAADAKILRLGAGPAHPALFAAGIGAVLPMARNLQSAGARDERGTMKHKQLTVSDLSQLIAAREETRAELRLLSLDAWERWRTIEAKLRELEGRLSGGVDAEHHSGVHAIEVATRVSESGRPLPASGKR